MPIYEYSCRECGGFEVTQKITDKPLTRCPACKGKVKKLISSTSFQLKGTGWYVTDYPRKEKAPKEEKKEKAPAAEAKGDGKASSSSDTGEKAPAEKKPAKSATSESTAP
ncbi:MAG TPA: FmdB family transcriptional regulator [Deltaproteobacteria bacterium]|nr:FmdB family transcriptional regulator [Deltaproteobacteria bacterium]